MGPPFLGHRLNVTACVALHKHIYESASGPAIQASRTGHSEGAGAVRSEGYEVDTQLERSVVYEVYVDILYRYDFEFYPAELLDGLSIMLHEAPRESVTKVIEVIVSAFFATKTPDPASRAAYVTLVCSNLQSLHVDAPDIFRLLCASFDVESDVVQREILVLGFSLWAFYFQVYHKKLSLDNLTGQFPWLADEEVVYRE